MFPKFANNSLFISGESYGGIYTPYLAFQIYEHNVMANATNGTYYPIKGFIVGNGATDWKYDVMPSFPDVIYTFNLVPKSLWKTYNDMNCSLFFNSTVKPEANKTKCLDTWSKFMNLTGDLNWYDLYRHNYDLAWPPKNDTDHTDHDVWGRPLEDYEYGKTVLNGKEYTYKRGFTFKDYVGKWNKNHPGVF